MSATADDIELRLGAQAANLPIVRSLAATVAIRADFDLDSIADLKLAVDEACSTLIARAAPGSTLVCRFTVAPDEIRFAVRAPSTSDRAQDTNSFGWQVLTTLTDHAATWVDGKADGNGDGWHDAHIEIAKRKG